MTPRNTICSACSSSLNISLFASVAHLLCWYSVTESFTYTYGPYAGESRTPSFYRWRASTQGSAVVQGTDGASYAFAHLDDVGKRCNSVHPHSVVSVKIYPKPSAAILAS
ncbi:hypothetical protein BD414DRAFT_298541 [Trametes punicea]|nr:hypothetical protein BD414DRAFT_298541 [Trametes punicea]